MRSIGRLLVFFAFLPASAPAQTADVTPTDLEDFLLNPNVVVEIERPLGQIESIDSFVSVVAIEAQDRANPGNAMRGVRIELRNNAWNQAVYLDDDQVAELSLQLEMMMMGREHDRKAGRPVTPTTIGTELCWRPVDPRRIICPSFTVDKVGETLSISVLGETGSFPLPGNQISDLASLISLATEKDRPTSEGETIVRTHAATEIEQVDAAGPAMPSAVNPSINSPAVDQDIHISTDTQSSSTYPRLLLALLAAFLVAVTVLAITQFRRRRD